ncbi:hypothetical protein C2E21_1565 [Chlorella sorokiniana]|uniref:Uncharacterized protein n=1 Tax=Chlorella sorokiniana TaxID=3076 RepID=A0A2P6U0G7_CHLSO|nr:hypothetical protein C2E21_1565 [Chlorella sorokiniana]|eukprot:PRW59807.1 hypothetical protein C2E21_1565 [Chlorella sorokiniana]
MRAAVLTRSFATAVARLPSRRPQAALRAYRAASPSHAAPRSLRHLAAPPPPAGRGSRHQQLRCLASRRDDEPSWGDIASEAGQVAKDLVKKLGSTVGKAASKVAEAIVPSEEKEAPVDRRARERRGDVYRPEDAFGGGLVGGLLGRAVGGMLRSAVGALGEQMRQAQEQVADVQDRATRIIESNSRLQDAMGGSMRAQPPVSQSSMSQNINGRMSKTVTLIMPVVGSGGRIAQAQVQYVEGGSSGTDQLTVSVRLPNGQVINLDGSSMAAGKTIDVEWREVNDK